MKAGSVLVIALSALLFFNSSGYGSERDSDKQYSVNIDWKAFLSRHDMVWKKLPSNWRESPWTGNGMIGAMLWKQSEALRLQVFRADVQTHRPMTQGFSGYTRARLQIGSFYLRTKADPIGCDLRMSYHDAELRGTIQTGRDAVRIRHFTYSEDMLIVVELESADGEGLMQVEWKPAQALPTRSGYARSEAKLAEVQKRHLSKYPTEIFKPNPAPVIDQVDSVDVCIQDMLGGSRHCTAWKLINIGRGKQRLVISIGNRWPQASNDPVADAVSAVKKVCELKGKSYQNWKQKHYDWWGDYYSKSFVSVPEIPLETMYWTQVYKLGSTTRADRVMIDTAGIWQTPSRWAYVTWDFNTQYCYYPVPSINHPELGMSLIDTIYKYRHNLIKNVRPVEWQEDSAYLPVNTGLDLYQPKDIDCRMFQETGGHLVWAMHACWIIYRSTMDDAILREKIYPTLRRAVNFQIHRLYQRDGKYHAPISQSPEYGSAPDANYELATLRWGCQALLAAAQRLGINDPLKSKWKDILENLTDYPVDDESGFMVGEGVPFAKPHRHWCHLMMIHPLNLVSLNTPEERDLVRRSTEHFAALNDQGDIAPFAHTGTSAMWSLLGHGDKALAELHKFMKNKVNTLNSMNSYSGANPCLETPIYAAQCINEMLLQSYDEFPKDGSLRSTIRIFPAVPNRWKDITFHDLRAQGAFLVSGVREDGMTRWVRIKSLAGEPCRLQLDLSGRLIVKGHRDYNLEKVSDSIYDLDIQKGEEAVIYPAGSKPDF
ncbi:MAG: glycosyl hydrolase family 95 catalytic domain-containing protein, partial [Planctomycetota bacterium]